MLFRAWDSPKEKSLDIAVSKLFCQTSLKVTVVGLLFF